ncbi:MAG: small multi-drug export protein [Candidatus Thermoplasmatota archaeon]|nr:small multi-drug export protein [Candidatus Thermoplasmatota archaeon]MBS3789292.1 small multi-drug export protein [Candidatus Thermoplasmatota archaeon]
MIGILKEEEELYENIWGKLFLFFVPFIIGFSYVGLLYLIFGNTNTFWIVGSAMFAYLFPPFGKETVIPTTIFTLLGLQSLQLSPILSISVVAGSVAYVDVVTSYFLLYNFYIAKKIPLLGKWIDKSQKIGARKMRKNEWIKRLAFYGVAAFVVVPFQGSGGVGASILGRVIGMNKYYAWISIITGAFIGSFLIGIVAYYTGGAIIRVFGANILIWVVGVFLVIVAFIFLYNFLKPRFFAESE